MLSTIPPRIDLTESERAAVSAILNKIKPFTIVLIEKIHNLPGFNKLSWGMTCLVLSFVGNIPSLLFGETSYSANFLLRLIYGTGYFFVALYPTIIFFQAGS